MAINLRHRSFVKELDHSPDELRFLVEELLSRGRHPNGAPVTPENLIAAGLPSELAARP